MILRRKMFWIGVGLCLLGAGGLAWAALTGSVLPGRSLAGSGGGLGVASQNYRLSGTIGQAVCGPIAGSSRALNAGFWQRDLGLAPVDEPPPELPRTTRLRGVHPNPFNPTTTIDFDLARRERTVVEIFDLKGRRVCTVLEEERPAGRHALRWSGRDDSGGRVASGIYLLRLRAGQYTARQKITLIK